MAAVSCGIDWAQDHHDVAVVDEHGAVICAERIGNDTRVWPGFWRSSVSRTRLSSDWR
ncbi:MAG: family transposase [Pseudonocardia sp.]|jgi:hypothetical protein|nr:family transposase [Pseudonocardia sp.]